MKEQKANLNAPRTKGAEDRENAEGKTKRQRNNISKESKKFRKKAYKINPLILFFIPVVPAFLRCSVY